MEDDAYEGSVLLPPMKVCPFCGSAKLKVQTVWNEYRYVCCRKCRAAGPVAKIVNHNVGRADEEAIDRWNHSDYRAPDVLQVQTNPRDIVPDLDEIEIFLNDVLDKLNNVILTYDDLTKEVLCTKDLDEVWYLVKETGTEVSEAQGAACEIGRIIKEMRNEEQRSNNDV